MRGRHFCRMVLQFFILSHAALHTIFIVLIVVGELERDKKEAWPAPAGLGHARMQDYSPREAAAHNRADYSQGHICSSSQLAESTAKSLKSTFLSPWGSPSYNSASDGTS